MSFEIIKNKIVIDFGFKIVLNMNKRLILKYLTMLILTAEKAAISIIRRI